MSAPPDDATDGTTANATAAAKKNAVARAVDHQLPGFEEGPATTKWSGPFYFVQAADTQLGLIANYGDGTIGDQYPNITWEREVMSRPFPIPLLLLFFLINTLKHIAFLKRSSSACPLFCAIV